MSQFFGEEAEQWDESWEDTVVSAGTQTSNQPPLPQPDPLEFFDDNHTDEWDTGYDSAPVGPNQPPRPVEDIYGHDTDDEGEDWESTTTYDSAPVGPSQPPGPVEDPLTQFDDDQTDEWEAGHDSAPVGVNAPITSQPLQFYGDEAEQLDEATEDVVVSAGFQQSDQPPLPPEDPLPWFDDDPTDDWDLPDDGFNVQNPNNTPPVGAPNEDPWPWFDDDNTEDVVGEDSAPVGANQPPLPVEDPFVLFDEDPLDEEPTDDGFNVRNQNQPPLPQPDPLELFDEDHTEDIVGFDSAPVGANAVISQPLQFYGDEAELLDETIEDFVLSAGGQQSDNTAQPPLPVEDPLIYFDDDNTEDIVGFDSAPVGLAAPITQPLQFYGNEAEMLDETIEDYVISAGGQQSDGTLPPVSAIQFFGEEAENQILDEDEDELVILDDAIFENYVVFEDPFWLFAEDYSDEEPIDDGFNVQNANVFLPQHLQYFGEDIERWDEDNTDELVGVDDSAPVGPPAPPKSPVQYYGEDAESWDEDHTDELVGVDESAPVGPNAAPPGVIQYYGDDADRWDEDHTDELGEIVYDSGPVGAAQPPLPVEDPLALFDDDSTDEPVGEESAPVGPNLPGPAIIGEDPVSLLEDDHTDEWADSGSFDSAPVGPNAVPVPPSQLFEDPWTQFEDDNDDQTVDLQEYSGPVGPDNPGALPVRQRRQWVKTWA